MRFRRGARLDASQVQDRRGMRGGPALAGGGGLIGIVVLVISMLTGGDPGGQGISLGTGGASEGDNTQLSENCQTGEDANQRDDCRIVGVVGSVQEFWEGELNQYERAQTVFFSGSTQTGCGGATSAVGPFYCPNDSMIYIDLDFYDELRSRFGARGGAFAEAYVIAHEYGHHVENLLGVLGRYSGDRSTGPQSASVRIELMADCFAGMWAQGAEETGYIEPLTDQDIADGLDAAAAVGDDRIQETVQGRVDPEKFSHGSAAQRQKWFRTGYAAADVDDCDTFATDTV